MADGTACCVIVPLSSIYGGGISNGSRIPFITVAATSTDNPYANTPAFSPPGPFQSQAGNFTTYNVDACMLDFI